MSAWLRLLLTCLLLSQLQVVAAHSQTLSGLDPAALAAAAPVKSVNTAIGDVIVPTLCRQQSSALAIPTTNPGVVSWTFPNTTCTFSAAPSCWSDITTSSTGNVFDYPLNTARTASSVTYSYTAHAAAVAVVVPAVLSLSLGGSSGAPPASSTVVLTCTAPPA